MSDVRNAVNRKVQGSNPCSGASSLNSTLTWLLSHFPSLRPRVTTILTTIPGSVVRPEQPVHPSRRLPPGLGQRPRVPLHGHRHHRGPRMSITPRGGTPPPGGRCRRSGAGRGTASGAAPPLRPVRRAARSGPRPAGGGGGAPGSPEIPWNRAAVRRPASQWPSGPGGVAPLGPPVSAAGGVGRAAPGVRRRGGSPAGRRPRRSPGASSGSGGSSPALAWPWRWPHLATQWS
jgi:hypothetical protein